MHYDDWRKVSCCLWGNIFITVTEGKWAAACEETYSLQWLKESELLPVRKHIHYNDWRKVSCYLWGNIFITMTEGKWAAACEEIYSLRWLKESELLPVRKYIHYDDWRKVSCCLWGNIFIMMTEGKWAAACEEIYSLWWLKESELLPVRKCNWDIVHALWVLFTWINDLCIAPRKLHWMLGDLSDHSCKNRNKRDVLLQQIAKDLDMACTVLILRTDVTEDVSTGWVFKLTKLY